MSRARRWWCWLCGKHPEDVMSVRDILEEQLDASRRELTNHARLAEYHVAMVAMLRGTRIPRLESELGLNQGEDE